MSEKTGNSRINVQPPKATALKIPSLNIYFQICLLKKKLHQDILSLHIVISDMKYYTLSRNYRKEPYELLDPKASIGLSTDDNKKLIFIASTVRCCSQHFIDTNSFNLHKTLRGIFPILHTRKLVRREVERRAPATELVIGRAGI